MKLFIKCNETRFEKLYYLISIYQLITNTDIDFNHTAFCLELSWLITIHL